MRPAPRCAWVYPRVCGEAPTAPPTSSRARGLSPRVRGSRNLQRRLFKGIGSIPACAGKPRSLGCGPTERRVYPRVCGEAFSFVPPTHTAQGLSPRVRGSRLHIPAPRAAMWSIPACAGKPPQYRGGTSSEGLSPRVRGSRRCCDRSGHEGGSIPRVRGSHEVAWLHRDRDGSIPACAGKPLSNIRQRCGSLQYLVVNDLINKTRSQCLATS